MKLFSDLPLVLKFPPTVQMMQHEFFTFCQLNKNLHIERNSGGDMTIMLPAGGETGGRNATLNALLWYWARADGRGVVFDSSTGFELPNGATYSPDAAWVARSRLVTLTAKEKGEFLPLCPDFVIELRSRTDRLKPLKAKMQEYIDNGTQLGWLIDPRKRTAYVYQPGQPEGPVESQATLSGDPILPGFVLDLDEIWQPPF